MRLDRRPRAPVDISSSSSSHVLFKSMQMQQDQKREPKKSQNVGRTEGTFPPKARLAALFFLVTWKPSEEAKGTPNARASRAPPFLSARF